MTKIIRLRDCVIETRPDGVQALRAYAEPGEDHYIIAVTQAQVRALGFERLVFLGGDGDQRIEKAAGAAALQIYGDRGEFGFDVRAGFAGPSRDPGDDVIQLGAKLDIGKGGPGMDTYVIHPADMLRRPDAPNTVLHTFDTRMDQAVVATLDEDADLFRFRSEATARHADGDVTIELTHATLRFETTFGEVDLDFRFGNLRPDSDPQRPVLIRVDADETRREAVGDFVEAGHDGRGWDWLEL